MWWDFWPLTLAARGSSLEVAGEMVAMQARRVARADSALGWIGGPFDSPTDASSGPFAACTFTPPPVATGPAGPSPDDSQERGMT